MTRFKPRKGIEIKDPRRSPVEISIPRTSQRSPSRPKRGPKVEPFRVLRDEKGPALAGHPALTSGSSMILRRISRYETRRNTHLYKHVLKCVCANFGKYLDSLHDSPLNVASWSQFTSDRLWASFWPSLDHEHFQASCDKFQFSKTQALIQSLQPKV